MKKNYNTPGKDQARKRSFAYVRKNCKDILTLPGENAYCVVEMLRMGICDSNTQFYVCEQDNYKIPAILQKFLELGLKIPIIYQGRFEDCRFPNTKFDFLNIDIDNGFSENLMNKIMELELSEQAVVIIWTTNGRNNSKEKIKINFVKDDVKSWGEITQHNTRLWRYVKNNDICHFCIATVKRLEEKYEEVQAHEPYDYTGSRGSKMRVMSFSILRRKEMKSNLSKKTEKNKKIKEIQNSLKAAAWDGKSMERSHAGLLAAETRRYKQERDLINQAYQELLKNSLGQFLKPQSSQTLNTPA